VHTLFIGKSSVEHGIYVNMCSEKITTLKRLDTMTNTIPAGDRVMMMNVQDSRKCILLLAARAGMVRRRSIKAERKG
jgi:hypothetical protein